jgi:subtilisin family serine protease
VSLLAAAAIVTAFVGLPPGATAPPPGSIPHGATVQVLDRQLGIVAVDLRRGAAGQALTRLRRAPGVRYATLAGGAGGFAAPAPNCSAPIKPETVKKTSARWRGTIRLSTRSAAGFTVGIADTGADLSRLGGTRDRLAAQNFTNDKGLTNVTDQVDHGTQIASLIGANRPDLGITGVAPDVGLAVARISKVNACDTGTIARNLITAFKWFREIGDVQIVNVSLTLTPTPALIESLRALQESGTLVVAATGDAKNPGKATFPAAQPHVLGVGALGSSSKQVAAGSGRGPQVDLVAPAAGSGVVYSSYTNRSQQAGSTPAGTSFATPIVAGAAALVWAKHSAWDASRVAAALMLSAKHLSGARPNTTSGFGRLDVKAALREVPPADLYEPNDWASAARDLAPLTHRTTLAATVGGANDPLDAYPFSTKGKSVITVRGKGKLQGYLVPARRLSAIEQTDRRLKAAATRSAAATTLHLRVPGKGRWYLVVAVPGTKVPVGYTLRVP